MIIDYKTDKNGDLLIEDGDFVKHDATQDHVERIILLNKGDLRQFPLVGVNALDFVTAPWNLKTAVSLEKTIRLQLESDGYTINKVNASDLNNIEIDAHK